MDLSFYPLTLEAFDQANAEALCLFVGEDERPLVGLSGLCDWRMSGGLSRMLRKGLVKGEEGEALLTPGLRLGFRKLFLFGMGPVGQPEEELVARLAERLRRLGRAGVEDAAFQIPQRLSLEVGIRTLVEEPNGPARARVFGPDPAAMVRALSQAATRGASEARHERRVIKVPPSHKAPPQVRTSGPVKAGLLEIPKASQLPFAPTQPQSLPVQQSLIAPPPNPPAPASKLAAALSPVPPIAAPASANRPEQDQTPIAPSASNPPAADLTDAEVPIAPPAELTPLPPQLSATPAVTNEFAKPAAATAPEKAAPAAAPDKPPAAAKPPPEPARAPAKSSLPVDYKAPRFVPPEPKPAPAGGKKSRKKKR